MLHGEHAERATGGVAVHADVLGAVVFDLFGEEPRHCRNEDLGHRSCGWVDKSLYIASVLDAYCCTAPTSLTGYAGLRPRHALTIELTAV